MKRICYNLIPILLLSPLFAHATFIESSVGTAVVNDATATYYNPAALMLLKNPQIIMLGSIAQFKTHFAGQATQTTTGFKQNGTSSSTTHYYLPSLYFGKPIYKNISMGVAVIGNDFNRDVDALSVLRYVQSKNSIQDVDLVSSLGFNLSSSLSFGIGIILSHAQFLLEPITGVPGLHIPDSQSRNDTDGNSWGGNIGILFKPNTSTLVGFNYRTGLTYELTGTSQFLGPPIVTSNNYHYKFWTPARSIFSTSHFISQSLGFIGTAQYIQSDIFNTVTIHNTATRLGIIPSANIKFKFHNSWIATFGTNYFVNSAWVIRVAGTYVQSPANGHFQITNGDSLIIGLSTGYQFNKCFTLDGSYAHEFSKDRTVNITTARQLIITGLNQGTRNAVSLKATINI